MKLRLSFALSLVCTVALSACSSSMSRKSTEKTAEAADPNLWLEEIESPRAIEQVKKWNQISQNELEKDSNYKTIEKDIRKILLAKDRIPYGKYFGDHVYNFWQDEKSVRGIWRRATLTEYRKKSPRWETILDLDALAKKENENWVWKGADCREPEFDSCLLKLSRGGKDAAVIREFSLPKKAFVEDGFKVEEAKTDVEWIDKDTLFVGTDMGAGSLTQAGYPRQVRVWKRGQNLKDSKVIFEGKVDDVAASGMALAAPEGTFLFVSRGITFTNQELYVYKDEKLIRFPVPKDFNYAEIYKKQLFGILRSDLTVPSGVFKAGSVVAYDVENLERPPSLVYSPADREAVDGVHATKDSLFLVVNRNVQGRLLRASLSNTGWKTQEMKTPEKGELSVTSTDRFSNVMLMNFASFLVPDSVLMLNDSGTGQLRIETIRSIPARFDASKLTVDQFESTSRDGTKVPYFVVRPKNMKLDGKNPTLLDGYGGFEIAMNPFYLNSIGKVFAEKGGVYVLANIRGGGEFGPAWHQAAKKQNRQKAYDDFISIAEDLIARKITSPQHLAISGGSNGGLLVGAVFVQRPDLFNGVVCQVPLLDMMRFHKLLAGFSWVEEYGNPDDPEMAKAIRAYSPYQNLKPDGKYPRIFLMTSTKDDRVHPGHARKFAAKLESMKHPFLYYENIEGGHGAAANIEQRIHFNSLDWTYVWKQVGVSK